MAELLEPRSDPCTVDDNYWYYDKFNLPLISVDDDDGVVDMAWEDEEPNYYDQFEPPDYYDDFWVDDYRLEQPDIDFFIYAGRRYGGPRPKELIE